MPDLHDGQARRTVHGIYVALFDPQPWKAQAACRGLDPALFYPERGDSAQPALRVCRRCPVAQECLDRHLEWPIPQGTHDAGVLGGTTPHERRAIKRERSREVA